MAGDRLHFKSLKGSRNAVLSDVVRRRFLGQVLAHIPGQSRRSILGHITAVVEVIAGLAAFHRRPPAIMRTGQVEKEIQAEEVIAELEVVRGVGRGAGTNC